MPLLALLTIEGLIAAMGAVLYALSTRRDHRNLRRRINAYGIGGTT